MIPRSTVQETCSSFQLPAKSHADGRAPPRIQSSGDLPYAVLCLCFKERYVVIAKKDLEKLNRLVDQGKTIADAWREFPQYTYMEVYWSVNNYSLQGKKKMITIRLNKLKSRGLSKTERAMLVKEVNGWVTDIYKLARKNGDKLLDIAKTVEK